MMNKKIIIGMLLLLISFWVHAQGDLNGYLQTAAENNPGLKVKFNDYLAALEVAPQVKALPDPQVAFAYFIQPVETRVGPQQFKISASQMFPWFGTLKAKENVAVQSAKAKYELFEDAKSKLFNDLRSAYFDIYVNTRAIHITRDILDILNIFKKLANIKVESGMVSAVDEYRVEMELGDLENQLALLLDKQTALEVIFNKLMNIDGYQKVNVPDTLWNTDIALGKKQLADSIMYNNHGLLSLALQKEALDYKKDVAQNLGRPGFSVGLDYISTGKGGNQFAGTDALVFPKIGLTIPLYRNKYKAMVNEVMYRTEAKDFEISDKENLLESIFENAWTEYQDADRRIRLYDSQLGLARQSIKLLETEYSTGNKNFEEILRMERRLLKYELELEKGRADKQASIAFINYLTGK